MLSAQQWAQPCARVVVVMVEALEVVATVLGKRNAPDGDGDE